MKNVRAKTLLVALAAICFTTGFAIACPAEENGPLRIEDIKPTVFFVSEQGQLFQVAEVTVENSSSTAMEAILKATCQSEPPRLVSCKLPAGKTTVQVTVPDHRKPASIQFELAAHGQVQDGRSVDWIPQRHWQIFFIPITHHDLGYTDTIENVMNQYADFYDDVLRFCRETDDWPEEARYRYTVEGCWSLQHFVENRPQEVVAELAKYVREGRIEIGALFGNEISALCSHEELIRLMYPSFRFGRQFQGAIRTGSITDVPGLAWGLPTVMADAGVQYFFAGLPTYFEWGRDDIHTFWDESAILRHGRPDAFRWIGPDGQSVLVYYQGSYGFFGDVTGPHSMADVMDRLPRELEKMQQDGTPFDVMRYIHNGVDNYPPKSSISQIVREWNSRWAYPKLVVGTNSMFFEAIEKQCDQIRSFRGELPHTDYVVGAISTAKETAINRLAHNRWHAAEKLSTIASITCGMPYPAEKIRQAYNDMILYDEHTWGKDYPAGELQDWAWNEKSHFAYRTAGQAEMVMDQSIRAIVDQIGRDDPSRRIVVFNPLSFDRTDVVRILRFEETEPFDLIDEETGHAIPFQILTLEGPQAPVPYAAYRHARGSFEPHELKDMIFIAENVPAMGYRTYRIRPSTGIGPATGSIHVKSGTLENRFFRIEVDPKTGGIRSLFDKELNREFVDSSAPHTVNQFVMRWIQTGENQGPADVEISEGQSGGVCASVLIKAHGPGCPQITHEITVYDRIKRIDFANRILKDSTPLQETYFAFPFKIDNPDFRFEGSNSVIKPFRDQFPGSNTNYYTVQHWADVSDSKVGLTLSPVESHLLEFGGLWPCYVSQAHHGIDPAGYGAPFVNPDQISKGHMYAFVMNSNFRTNFQPVQQSDILFRYSIFPHAGDWKAGQCPRFGWSVGNPLFATTIQGRQDGPLPTGGASFCQIDHPNVFLTALKQAEEGDGIIFRLTETMGQETMATITLPHVTVKGAIRTNIVEERRGELPFTEHDIRIQLKPFGIATLRAEILPQ
ncbi:MAG: hypothetical protein JW829_02385 [Pirellulales bacterium]|nr:hypothetical protein [Pirellulales bacterium]